MEKTDAPKVLHVAEPDRATYNKIKETTAFRDKEWRDVFTLCVALGYEQGARLPLPEGERHFLLRTESMQQDQVALINAVAIADTKGIEVLADQKQVWTIAEEYANGGIQLLKDKTLGATEAVFVKHLELQLLELLTSTESAGAGVD